MSIANDIDVPAGTAAQLATGADARAVQTLGVS